MAFVDQELNAGLSGKTVTGLALSQTAAMTLEVATGTVSLHQDGSSHTLSAAQSHVFTADSTNPTQVFIALISDDGVNVDVWIDAYVDAGLTQHADVPTGFRVVADIAWFTIAANETDIVVNGTVNRRTWV